MEQIDRAQELGRRLRDVRKKAGYTLDWTANEIGVTKGYLSKVERGQASPSIAVMTKLSEAYGVSLAEVFMPEGERKPISVLRAGELRPVNRNGSNVGYRYEIGDLTKANPRAEVYFLTLPIWTKKERPPINRHKGEEVLLMLEGQMMFKYMGMELVLNEGDCIQFDADQDHYGYAIGGRQARAFVVIIRD
ncbi:helix-turn-helix domain-containing protein [Thalassovita sp.]|uniref:helix-turn-helix domain-containing protein n=1 Tax=Thalassovita sp. TaxID=1979401 RepID=UPI0029DE5F1D|nr:helix-turn-helix domain-containing protein [Thalassovita sp.]